MLNAGIAFLMKSEFSCGLLLIVNPLILSETKYVIKIIPIISVACDPRSKKTVNFSFQFLDSSGASIAPLLNQISKRFLPSAVLFKANSIESKFKNIVRIKKIQEVIKIQT